MRKINETYKPLVFILCDENDGTKFRDLAIKKGCIPIVPSLLFKTYDEHFNYVLLGKCDKLWCFNTSYLKEIEVAKKRHMPIVTSIKELDDERV